MLLKIRMKIEPINPSMAAQKTTITTPGRINLIGDHTDYNNGWALPGAIDRYITVSVKPIMGNQAVVVSRELEEEVSIDLDHPKSLGGWTEFPVNVVKIAQRKRLPIRGFHAKIKTTLPIGGGLSSSAALLCGFIQGLSDLFEWQLEPMQIAVMAQEVEQNAVGVQCGLMDQVACMRSKKDHLMLLDCQSLAYQYIPVELSEHELLLLNTNIRHQLSDSAYNQRREECVEAISILQKKIPKITSLRNIALQDLTAHQNLLPKFLFNRCHHVLTENERVHNVAQYLLKGTWKELGQTLYKSHESLQKRYEVSCLELDYLVDYTKKTNAVLGARMMGGGFGGCTINLIQSAEKDAFLECVTEDYFNEFGLDLSILSVNLSDGMMIEPAW